MAENAALAHEWFAEEGLFRDTDRATGRELSPGEVAERSRSDGPPLLDLVRQPASR
jgi:hypothetical protein